MRLDLRFPDVPRHYHQRFMTNEDARYSHSSKDHNRILPCRSRGSFRATAPPAVIHGWAPASHT